METHLGFVPESFSPTHPPTLYFPQCPTNIMLDSSPSQTNVATAINTAIGEAIRLALPPRNAPLSQAATQDIPAEIPPAHTSTHRPRVKPAQPTDVTLQQRADIMAETKAKFSDVFKVHPVFESMYADIESFDDTVNVKGRLNLPESIEFFEKIGASELVLNTLKNGHFPKLKCPVPDYEIENHGSFRKHYDFAMNTISGLLSKGER